MLYHKSTLMTTLGSGDSGEQAAGFISRQAQPVAGEGLRNKNPPKSFSHSRENKPQPREKTHETPKAKYSISLVPCFLPHRNPVARRRSCCSPESSFPSVRVVAAGDVVVVAVLFFSLLYCVVRVVLLASHNTAVVVRRCCVCGAAREPPQPSVSLSSLETLSLLSLIIIAVVFVAVVPPFLLATASYSSPDLLIHCFSSVLVVVHRSFETLCVLGSLLRCSRRAEVHTYCFLFSLNFIL
ncbi:hypothetical protein BVRB_1g013420 [Beta vulgaris subsp. vulgaris]|nr:hypothetical protein BVRB_1g013420 [Beta vulgaris subsp. vulgaris]